MEDTLRDDVENEREMSIGNRLMLLGHLLNGIAMTLLSVGSIIRDNEEVPFRLRSFDNTASGRATGYWERD